MRKNKFLMVLAVAMSLLVSCEKDKTDEDINNGNGEFDPAKAECLIAKLSETGLHTESTYTSYSIFTYGANKYITRMTDHYEENYANNPNQNEVYDDYTDISYDEQGRVIRFENYEDEELDERTSFTYEGNNVICIVEYMEEGNWQVICS